MPWRPGLAEEQDEGETGEKREEQRSLTGQKAEPLGMKFTLFLSGHEKRGKPFDLPDLKTKQYLWLLFCILMIIQIKYKLFILHNSFGLIPATHNANKLVSFVELSSNRISESMTQYSKLSVVLLLMMCTLDRQKQNCAVAKDQI